jgi:glutaredoxin-like protein
VIPLRDQEYLRQRFQRDLTSRLRIDLFTQKPSSILIPGRQECALCNETQALLEELAALSERISLSVHELADSEKLAADLGVDKVPGIVVRGQANRPVRFFGLPFGLQFMGFIETLIDAATGKVQLQADTARQLRRLKNDIHLEVLVTPGCTHSPAVARSAFKLALQSVRVKVDVVELSEFAQVATRNNVHAVPATLIDGKVMLTGAMDEHTLAENLLRAAEGKPLAVQTRVGPATAFQLAGPQPAAQPRAQRLSSGLILPP